MNQMHNFFNNASSMMSAMGNMGGSPLGNMANLMQMFSQFKNNPVGALMGIGYNIPQNVQNNPEAIVNYLMSSGQMSEQQFNQFSGLARQFQNGMGGKF